MLVPNIKLEHRHEGPSSKMKSRGGNFYMVHLVHLKIREGEIFLTLKRVAYPLIQTY